MFDKILVPLDGSDLSKAILPYVVQVAKGAGASLVLVSVIDPSDLDDHRRIANVPDDALSDAQEHSNNWLSGIADSIKADAVDVHFETVLGRPAEAIAKMAADEGCDLVAMSTHGRSAITRGILGSVTDRIVHTASVPVLTMTPARAKAYSDGRDKLTEVLVALDGSELSELVLPYVEDIALKLSLKVTLVRVISGISAAFVAEHPYEGSTEVQTALENECNEYLQNHADRLAAKGLEVERIVMRGAPAIQILDLIRQRPHDLVVLATHGRSGINRMIMGSVAEKIIRASNDPILVVPAGTG